MPGTYRLFTLIIGLAVILTAPATRADETIGAADPQRVLAVIQNFGEASLGTDNLGDPRIGGMIEGKDYRLFFYGCSRGRDCNSLTFSASWAGEDLTAAMMTDWNRENRFGKAYLDQDGQATVEMSVNLEGGVSPANLENTIDWWRLIMVEFADKFDL